MSVINQMLKDLEQRKSFKQRTNTLVDRYSGIVFSAEGISYVKILKIILLFCVISFLGVWAYKAMHSTVQPVEKTALSNLTGTSRVDKASVASGPPIFSASLVDHSPAKNAGSFSPPYKLEKIPVKNPKNLLTEPLVGKLSSDLEEIVPALGSIDTAKQPLLPPNMPVKIKRSVSRPEKAEALFQEGLLLAQREEYEEAEKLLKQSLAIWPDHHEARETNAKLNLQLGRLLEAEQQLNEGLMRAPRHVPFIMLKARLLMEEKKQRQALILLVSNAALGGAHSEYLSLMATLYQEMGQPVRAIPLYQQAVRVQNHNWRAQMGLAMVLEEEGELPLALDAYKMAQASPNLDKESRQFVEERIHVLGKR